MSNKVKPKAAAAKYGCLSTRQWQDIRRAARLASSEGITLIMHGVSVIPTTRDSENLSQSENNSTTTSARGGRGLQPKESIGKACENPSAKQLHEQQLTKQQREQERSLRRLHDFQQAFACGARWKLLRKERAISRAQVWTAHMERRLAMREKMRAFLLRVVRHASSSAHPVPMVDRDRAKLGLTKLRRMVYQYDGHITLLEARRMRQACSAANARANMRDLFSNYRVALNFEAATAGLEPFDENRSPLASLQAVSPHNSRPPGEQRGAKGTTKKPKSSRSRGRR
jgi:hypothetical protein